MISAVLVSSFVEKSVIYHVSISDHLSVAHSLDNARQKLKEKKDGLKKTEQSYKKDESAFETLKKTIVKLEVRWRSLGVRIVKWLSHSTVVQEVAGSNPGAAEKCWAVMELFVNIYLYEFGLSLLCVCVRCFGLYCLSYSIEVNLAPFYGYPYWAA